MRRLAGILLLFSLNAAPLPAVACAAAPEAPAGTQRAHGGADAHGHAHHARPAPPPAHLAHAHDGPALHHTAGVAHQRHAAAVAGAADESTTTVPDRTGPHHDSGCALLMRCHWSAVPALPQHTAADAGTRGVACAPPAALVAAPFASIDTPPPRTLS